jgi:hypothetical protein
MAEWLASAHLPLDARARVSMQASDGPGRLNNTHPALRRCWHPVARCGEIGEEPVRVELLGRP